MLGMVRDLGDGATYGMLSYPGGVEDAKSGCSTGDVRTQIQPLKVTQASSDIRRLAPDGETPTGPALDHAKRLLEAAGYDRGTIVLVSDGLSNCGEAPCEVAQRIADSGFDLRVYPVGFHIAGEADELECVADVTGGQYLDASNEQDLQEALGNAVPAHLVLTPQVPNALTIRTGTYNDITGGSQISATVTSDGRLPAHDVRISLTLENSVGAPILVAKPIRYLGNLAVGASRTVTFDARPEEDPPYAKWELTVTARNAASRTVGGRIDIVDGLDLDNTGPLLTDVEKVVVVGDSYSSGEGSGVYDDDSPANCHRSTRAYAGWLYEDDATQLACSGAVTDDFYNWQESGSGSNRWIAPQLETLRNHALGKNPPDAVFMSIGGNDAGFGAVVTACIVRHKCRWGVPLGDGSSDQHMRDLAEDIRDDVHSAIKNTDRAVNDATAQAKRGGGAIPVIVVPYVRIIPEVGAGRDSCQLGLSETELNSLNRYFDAVNRSVKAATDQLRFAGRPVYYASYVIDAFQPNHTVCEGVEVSFANMDNWQAWEQQDAYITDQQVLHPTSRGYQAEARAIVAWSHSTEATPVEVTTDVTWDSSVITWDRETNCIPLMCILEPSGPVVLARAGFASESVVVARVASTPHTLGTVRADASGRVNDTLRLPEALPAGKHRILLTGIDRDGEPVIVSYEIRVWPRGSLLWLGGAIFGLLLLLTAAVGLRITKRSEVGRTGAVLATAPSTRNLAGSHEPSPGGSRSSSSDLP